MNTFMANPDKIEKKWYVVDATDCTWDVWLRKPQSCCEASTSPVHSHVDTGDSSSSST